MHKAALVGTVVLAISASSAFAQPPIAAAGKVNPDSRFVTDAAKGGMAEVELGKLATEKAGADQVKKFGQLTVDEHRRVNEELKTLAQNKDISLPTAEDGSHRAIHEQLAQLSGDAFDRAYLRAMVDSHLKTVYAFRVESRSGKDPDVKAWASKTLPMLEDHLKRAQEANKAAGSSFLERELFVDDPLERLEWLGAPDHAAIDEERGCTVDAGLFTRLNIRVDLRLVFV
jgi:putative membrane protein